MLLTTKMENARCSKRRVVGASRYTTRLTSHLPGRVCSEQKAVAL